MQIKVRPLVSMSLTS